MNKKLLVACMILLGVLLALSALYNKKQNDKLKTVKIARQQCEATLNKSENERDDLEAKVVADQQEREQLQKKVDELTSSCKQLQEQVEKLTFSKDQSRQYLTEIIDTRDKLKKQVVDLSDSRDKLQRLLYELCDAKIQLSRQVKKLTESRDKAVAKAQTAQEQIEILVTKLDSEKQESSERQDTHIVTNQDQKETQAPIIKISENSTAATEVSQPAVTSILHEERPVCHNFNTICPRITQGHSCTLSWQVSNADRIRIEPYIGPVGALGSVAVRPSTATTYTLIATNKVGESKITCRVEIADSPTVQEKL
jgi:peptidoglycan hydrolase CwlO-like protein